MEEIKHYKVCPHCACKVLLERYQSHINTQHSPEADLKRILHLHEIEENRKLKEIEGEEVIRCELCGIEVKRKNLNKHKYNAHKKKKKDKQKD